MDLHFSPADEAFRAEVRDWLLTALEGEFKLVRGRGGPGDEEALFDERVAWEQHLAKHNWNCIDWPKEHGGRDLPLMQQVIFYEEYVKAGGPGRLGHIGETLAGPTIIAFGDTAQKTKFLPGIKNASERWCQGYSEPNAGSDLANVQTKAELKNGQWIINGQKVWTSGAQWSKWSFVLCRTDADAPKHKGISYILVPMDQPGVEIRPIKQMTGTSEFNEVFFDNAGAAADDVVGDVNNGWKVAMGTLAFERGASTLGQQAQFLRELEEITTIAKGNGKIKQPDIRDRLAKAWIELKIMRLNALRILSNAIGPDLPREALVSKLYWATWHRDMGKLAMDILGSEALLAEPNGELTQLQRLFLFVRSDTIYAGTNQIQRNIVAERGLGLPR